MGLPMITGESVNAGLRAFSRQVIQSYKLILSFRGIQLVNSDRPTRPRGMTLGGIKRAIGIKSISLPYLG